MAACAVCLVAAAAIVMVPVLALAHRQADPPPARTGQLTELGQTGCLDAGSLLGLYVPADAQRDACAAVAACATRDPMVVVLSRPGQASVVLEHGVAGPVHPSRRMAMLRTRVVHAGGHAVAILAADAEWHGSVTFTRLVWPMDAFDQRLPVEPVVRSHVHPTSPSAHGEPIALHTGRLHDRTTRLVAVACAEEPGSARGPSPNLEKWTPEVSDQIRFHFRGLFTYCVSA